MEITETEARLLPIEGLPSVPSIEILDSIIADKEQELYNYKEALKAFIWSTEPNKIKPTESNTVQWIGSNIDNLIGSQNQIGNIEVLLYKLKTWKKFWRVKPQVKGFQSTAQREEDSEGEEEVELILDSEEEGDTPTVEEPQQAEESAELTENKESELTKVKSKKSN